MATSPKLGGFKTLKDVVWFSLFSPLNDEPFLAKFCRILAREKINLLYMACLPDARSWGLSIAVDIIDEGKALSLIEKTLGMIVARKSDSAILSVFPYKGDPRIAGLLLEALGAQSLELEALANSPAAISAVLKREHISQATKSLFGPFSFSAYRTPNDWKLAQKGRETLYKEVVASYQEKKPKVYGLKYRENQELLRIDFENKDIRQIGRLLMDCGGSGSYLSFIATCPRKAEGHTELTFCLSRSSGSSNSENLRRISPVLLPESRFPVTTFSMTGPHFGDRYGIVSELLSALEKHGIELMGLICSVASIKGVVSSERTPETIKAIQDCFEVPALIKRE